MNSNKKILDIGTGTGLIALMAAQRTSATITALEPHPDSLRLACKNFLASPWSSRIRGVGSSLQAFSTSDRFDLIVSNPPFFSNSLLPPSHTRKIHRHTQTLSLDDLADSAVSLLTATGRFSLILPVGEAQLLLSSAKKRKLIPHRITEVYTKRSKPVERLLMELGFEPQPLIKDSITLMEDNGLKTEAYSCITKEFYL